MDTLRPRHRLPGSVEREIRSLVEEKGYTNAAEIERELSSKGRRVDIRTIRARVKEYTVEDPSGRWTLAGSPGALAALILPVLAAVIENSEGHISHLTNAQAAWIVKVRRAAPDLSPWGAFCIAAYYRIRQHRNEPTADLDLLLAFAPWRGREHLKRFFSTITSVFPDWMQVPSSELPEDATLEERIAAQKSTAIAESLYLAMQMQIYHQQERGGRQ